MGLQLKHLSCREVIHLISMKQFVVLFCLVPFALCEADAEADPGYGHGRYGGHYQRKYYAPKCHTTYETVTSQACTTVSEPVCHTRTVTPRPSSSVLMSNSAPLNSSAQIPSSALQCNSAALRLRSMFRLMAVSLLMPPLLMLLLMLFLPLSLLMLPLLMLLSMLFLPPV